MTPERINDDVLLDNAKEALEQLDLDEYRLTQEISVAEGELVTVRKMQKMLRGSRQGRPRGSRNRPRVVSADDVEESASTRNVNANQAEVSEEDTGAAGIMDIAS